jgi:hypothetical protein
VNVDSTVRTHNDVSGDDGVQVGPSVESTVWISYAAPSVSGLQYSTLPTAGGSLLLISGTNFYPNASLVTVLAGSLICPVSTVFYTQIWCTLPPGWVE